MLRKDKNKSVSLFSLTVLCGLFLLVISGVSYAFLSQVLKGTKQNEVVAGTLAIEYKDKKTISLDNIYPMSDERGMMLDSYQFSVENTGDVKALYDISLEEDQSTMNHSFLKYSLKRNNEEWSEPKVLDSLKLREQIELEVGSKDSYELKMWMDEKVGNEGQNKVFKARVVISSVQSNASSKDVTPPVIKLKGSLSESVEQNKEYVDAGVESIVDDKDTLNKEDVTVTYEYYDGENTKEVESIDTSKLGVYYITYTISDKSGNIGKIIRSVNIYKKNTIPPVIRLNGNNLIAIKRGEAYSELGASASSGEANLTNRVVTVGKVNTNKSGSYEIKYLITDNDGNTASIVRIVNVIHITSDVKTDIKLDLPNKPTDKVKLEGENLGDITYTSSDPDIVTVDENGNVEGKNPGTATITITTSTGHKETIIITVTKTVNITYEKSTGISSIGKTSDTCEITEKNGSCHVTLPTIEGAKGYTVSGWYEGETKVGNANDSVTVTSNKTYTAKANAKTYTIIYHSNGGSGEMSSQTVKAGESVSIKTNSFTKEGYTFAGWTTNSNGSDDGHNWTSFNGTWNFDNGDKGITENKLNLYARWNINQYNVTYDYATNGGNSATKTSAKVNYNSAIDLTPTASKSGWTFVGWNTNKDAHEALKSLNMGTSNVTLYAIFRKEAITRTVTYEKGTGVSAIGKTSDSCTIPAVYNNATQGTSCTVTLPSITASKGYTVDGWYQNTTKRAVGASISLSGDVSYEARAIANTYTISYNANGGSGSMTNTTATTGKNVSISGNSFTKEGYSFAGWTTRSNGEDDGYNWTNWSGTWNYDNGQYGISSNKLTLYARWSINQYSVTYNYSTNGGSSATKTSAKVNYNSAIDLTPSATKSGWTFVGWNTNKDATGALSSLTMKTSNVTLYAIFRKEAKTITITFNKNGASTQTNDKNTAVGDATVTRSCTIPTVYNNATQASSCNVSSPTIGASTNTPNIIGYSTSASDHSNTWPHNTAKAVSSNATYYAQTKKDAVTRTVTYVKQGTGVTAIGKTSDSCTIGTTYNGTSQGTTCTVTAPSITVATNYTARGWSTSSDAITGISAGGTITLSGNSTYYSISYKNAITYSVNFNANGNTINATSKSCTIGVAYNNDKQATSCNVTTPTITAPTATPTIVGYNQTSTATSSQVGSNATLTVNSSNNGKTYYAITKKDAVTRTISYVISNDEEINSRVALIGQERDSCTIGATYNGTAQSSSCNVITPTITSPNGYTTKYFSTTKNATSGIAESTTIQLTSNSLYYAIARDTTKPIWSIVSTNPPSGTVGPQNTLTITFKGTDA